MEHFYHLFHYDFSAMEKKLGVACFETLTHYHSMAKAENTYNKSVSEKSVIWRHSCVKRKTVRTSLTL